MSRGSPQVVARFTIPNENKYRIVRRVGSRYILEQCWRDALGEDSWQVFQPDVSLLTRFPEELKRVSKSVPPNMHGMSDVRVLNLPTVRGVIWCATGHKTVCGMPTDGTNGAFKSLNYTSATGAHYGTGNTSRNAFMFLQDVALGLAETRTSACFNQHRPANYPKNDFIFACGSKNNGGFVHDELVTFSQDAQIFRYLVEIEVV